MQENHSIARDSKMFSLVRLRPSNDYNFQRINTSKERQVSIKNRVQIIGFDVWLLFKVDIKGLEFLLRD
jgi:hypothetical protein